MAAERRATATSSSARAKVMARSSMRPPARSTNMSSSTMTTTTTTTTTRPGASARWAGGSRAPSPAGSLHSVNTTAGSKRKEREFDHDDDGGGEATNINVVVRCRGRNEREVRENSAVVVSTQGVKGKLVELSMGPSALSNKTYNFDGVFSQAADQSMIFDNVVKPILDDMLAGFNCTIFAYGQTGTGKTYTMTGDMSENFGLLSDAAGIIPRVLTSLFNKLEIEDTESSVRCSFIELYNEELRDLLSPDDTTKLKIYDDNSRKGQATTVVQGVEERHILKATEGLKWLQEGSVRRQVAATKCNDLSSRSHTVFTITVVRAGADGQESLSAGKLNLVDLAGSENIQRSGAENKRAAEAGLINKSLLTLGRVINALVDGSAHIPYRESKLTRLLQDSLGGRTKTCIIATVSPAKSNLEETISTLDYAFRAKNIRNKPQLNALINKKTMLREFTAEIEKLKSELAATRQRNGVYMAPEAYEDMTVQSESRRMLAEEQAARIETMEANLRGKVQDMFSLTASLVGLKKDHEAVRQQLEEAHDVLDQTQRVLAATRTSLAEETLVRRAHQATEEELGQVGDTLLATLETTVRHVGALHDKDKRRRDLQALNRRTWDTSQSEVAAVTKLVEDRIECMGRTQQEHIARISERTRSFVQDELAGLASAQDFLHQQLQQLGAGREDLDAQRNASKADMDDVLDELHDVRDKLKQSFGESLQALGSAAERMAGEVLGEMTAFHSQLYESYGSLGRDCKSAFEDLLRIVATQRAEADGLRRQAEDASRAMVATNEAVAARMQVVLDEERQQAAAERKTLLAQVAALMGAQAERQESRLSTKTTLIQQTVRDANKALEGGMTHFSDGMDRWGVRDGELVDEIARSRHGLETKLGHHLRVADQHSKSMQDTAKSVHAETVRVADEQLKDLDEQMKDMDVFLSRARAQNATQQAQQATRTDILATAFEATLSDAGARLAATAGRAENLAADVDAHVDNLQSTLEPLGTDVCQPLANLRDDVATTVLREYEATGETPERRNYRYPTVLPRTAPHEVLLAHLRDEEMAGELVSPSRDASRVGPSLASATSTSAVFSDLDSSAGARSPCRPVPSLSMSLREVHPNTTSTAVFDATASAASLPPVDHEHDVVSTSMYRRSLRKPSAKAGTIKGTGAAGTGTENLLPFTHLAATVGGRRKSARLH